MFEAALAIRYEASQMMICFSNLGMEGVLCYWAIFLFVALATIYCLMFHHKALIRFRIFLYFSAFFLDVLSNYAFVPISKWATLRGLAMRRKKMYV